MPPSAPAASSTRSSGSRPTRAATFHDCAPDAIPAELGGADLIVVADPAASRFVPDVPPTEATPGANLFLAVESTKPRNALSYAFRETPGGIMQVTTWPQAAGSTAIVEASAQTIKANGLDHASADTILAFCRKHFGDAFDGALPSANPRLATVRHCACRSLARRQDRAARPCCLHIPLLGRPRRPFRPGGCRSARRVSWPRTLPSKRR